MDTEYSDAGRTDTTVLASAAARRALPPLALAGAGILFAAGGLLHPDGDTVTQLLAPTWPLAHSFLLAALALLAAGAGRLWAGAAGWPRQVRTATLVLAGAAVLSVVEMVPHLLASSEAHAVEHGGAHPLLDMHQSLGLVSNAVLGLSVAALAVLAARTRTLGSGAVPAAFAVLGGVAFAVAAPLIVATGIEALGVLFSGSVLMGLWLVLSGALLLRRR